MTDSNKPNLNKPSTKKTGSNEKDHSIEPPFSCIHQPFDSSLWQGRAEPYESNKARYWYQSVAAWQQSITSPIGIVGYACDQGVRRNLGRVGAKKGPASIRQALAKLPISATLQAQLDEAQLGHIIADYGDFVCQDNEQLAEQALEQTQAAYSAQISTAIAHNKHNLVIGLGGGHAIAYASYMGLWQALHPDHGKDNASRTKTNHTTNHAINYVTNHVTGNRSHAASIGIINFDAHLDLRRSPVGTSGTPFRQIAQHNQQVNHPFHYCCIGVSQYANTAALFARAKSLGVRTISDDDCYRLPWQEITKQLDDFITQVDHLYITIDMDCFPASVVPGVSAPAAKGISLDFVERCLSHLITSGKVTLVDMAELNPIYDIDTRSAKVSARLLSLVIETQLTTLASHSH